MKNKLIIISGILLLLFLSNISAEEIDLQAGDSYTFYIRETYEYYTIEGNKTEVDLNITQERTIITITTSEYMQSDSFEITFFDKDGEIIHKYSVENDAPYWQCGNWSECIDGIQIRMCEDLEEELPNRNETKECFLEFVPLNHKNNEFENILNANQESPFLTNVLTGAVTGLSNFAKSRGGIVMFLGLVIIIILGVVFFRIRRTF